LTPIQATRSVTVTEASSEGGIKSWLAMHYFGRLGGREYEKMKAEENRKTGLSLITAPTASGWSDPLPGGIRTHWRFFPVVHRRIGPRSV